MCVLVIVYAQNTFWDVHHYMVVCTIMGLFHLSYVVITCGVGNNDSYWFSQIVIDNYVWTITYIHNELNFLGSQAFVWNWNDINFCQNNHPLFIYNIILVFSPVYRIGMPMWYTGCSMILLWYSWGTNTFHNIMPSLLFVMSLAFS